MPKILRISSRNTYDVLDLESGYVLGDHDDCLPLVLTRKNVHKRVTRGVQTMVHVLLVPRPVPLPSAFKHEKRLA
jgi:hypothetical protein